MAIARPAAPLPPTPIMTAGQLEGFLVGAFPGAPRPYDVTEITERGAVLRLPVTSEHQRPGGTVSGPAMMGLADAAAWIATLSRIGPIELTVTSSLTINFLRKPSLTDLWAEAELIKLGRRLSVSDVRMYSDGDGTLVAQANVTYAIPAT